MIQFKELWVAVIMQAIVDLEDVSKVERSKARTWLLSKTSTFQEVCDYLKLDADNIRKGIFYNEKARQ